MRQVNVIQSREPVKSARKAGKILRLNSNTFSRAQAAGYLRPQAWIEGERRDSFGFDIGYLEDIDKVLPRDRGPGMAVFSKSVIEKITNINKKWQKLYPFENRG